MQVLKRKNTLVNAVIQRVKTKNGGTDSHLTGVTVVLQRLKESYEEERSGTLGRRILYHLKDSTKLQRAKKFFLKFYPDVPIPKEKEVDRLLKLFKKATKMWYNMYNREQIKFRYIDDSKPGGMNYGIIRGPKSDWFF